MAFDRGSFLEPVHLGSFFPSQQQKRAREREAATANVRVQVEKLTQDPEVMRLVNAGKLMIVGAFYELSSGMVDFLMEVSKPESPYGDLKPSPGVQSRYNPKTKKTVYA